MELRKNSYKHFPKLRFFKGTHPAEKILRFKRIKWKNVQRQIKSCYYWLKRRREFTQIIFKRIRLEGISFSFHKSHGRKLFLFRKKKVKRKKFKFTMRSPFAHKRIAKRSKKLLRSFGTVALEYHRNNSYKYLKRDRLNLQRCVFLYYERKVNSLTFRRLLKAAKKFKLKAQKLVETIARPLYFLAIVLRRAGFFKSTFQLKFHILKKNVFVNGNVAHYNQRVKQGDVVSILEPDLILWRQLMRVPVFFFSMLEIDYYLKSVIILGDCSKLTEKSLMFFFPERFKYQLFLEYITLK